MEEQTPEQVREEREGSNDIFVRRKGNERLIGEVVNTKPEFVVVRVFHRIERDQQVFQRTNDTVD